MKELNIPPHVKRVATLPCSFSYDIRHKSIWFPVRH